MQANNNSNPGGETVLQRLPAISALTALAALLHDLGKATLAFQQRLNNPGVGQRNEYRHEWVSVRLFQAFVGEATHDVDWLTRLALSADADPRAFEAQWLNHRDGRLLRDGLDEPQAGRRLPFATMPPMAQAVAWLVLTHHRMPCKPIRAEGGSLDADTGRPRNGWLPFGAHFNSINRRDMQDLLTKISADWNQPRGDVDGDALAEHWTFPFGLPVVSSHWRQQAAQSAGTLLALRDSDGAASVLDDPFVMHVSRLCLMLADHHYSSITDEARRKPYLNPGYPLYANSLLQRNVDRQRPRMNQTLDEHLLGVQAHSSLVAHSLPTLKRSLPALQSHRGLTAPNTDPRFHWQDKAADLAAAVRLRAAEHGAFVVNMASTGCGKTLGNARIMNALADPQLGMRCAFAIGLRSLTLQTGRVFQRDLGLGGDELAIKVGGAASRALFDYWEARAESNGSASAQALLDEGGRVLFDGDERHALLERLTDDAQVRSLIAAPLLACTVDHLIPATESLRGGRQIAPMLRLMTGDLVLDEPDDFDMDDLPAMTRLVHWAGLLGARVLFSSATLPPALVRGLYLAYLEGRSQYERDRSHRPEESPNVACLWIDEFAQSHGDCSNGDDFARGHEAFVKMRCSRLANAPVLRRAELIELPEREWKATQRDKRRDAFASLALQRAWTLHQDEQNHTIDAATGKHVSLGLIRMANIDALFDVALAMHRQGAPAPEVRVHLCVYHSQFPLLARSHIEQQLDAVFNRRLNGREDGSGLQHPSVRALIESHNEPHHMFVVLASPVCEVGRDWDADWAVAEPSSMRSLIQLAGRVRRHRPAPIERANMAVFDTNLRYFERADAAEDPAFSMPGFEMRRAVRDPHVGQQDSQIFFHLESHRLNSLLDMPTGKRAWTIDAQPRIQQPEKLQPNRRLVDLEHARVRDTMLPRDGDAKIFTPVRRDATCHWYSKEGRENRTWLTGVLPQLQRFRREAQPREDVVLLPNEGEDELRLHRVIARPDPEKPPFADIRNLLSPVPASGLSGPGIGHWFRVDLMDLLRQWAISRDQSLAASAQFLTVVSLPESKEGWKYHPAFGFRKN